MNTPDDDEVPEEHSCDVMGCPSGGMGSHIIEPWLKRAMNTPTPRSASDTPRTDAAVIQNKKILSEVGLLDIVDAGTSRQIERELYAAQDKALRFDLDEAGIEQREKLAVEVVELRAILAGGEDAHAEQLRAVNARELVYANSLAALRKRAERAEDALAEARKDAARWRYWRDEHKTNLLCAMFGNGCINKTIEMVEEETDAAIAAREPAKPAAPEGGE